MPGAYAADQADTGEAGGLQEVVVTAQKRVENLQDVPISASCPRNREPSVSSSRSASEP